MARGPADHRSAWLVWGGGDGINRGDSGQTAELTQRQSLVGEVYRIGRDPGAEIRFADAAVSKQHRNLHRHSTRAPTKKRRLLWHSASHAHQAAAALRSHSTSRSRCASRAE